MKKLIVLALTSCIAFSAMNVSAKEKPSPVKDAIHSHMIENGFITQAELDADKATREETRSLMKELKDAGDEEAIAELKEEIKAQREDKREFTKSYVEANPDLQTTINEIVAEFKLNKQQDRSDRQARNSM